ncbi:orotate phosphoribosyltransferase [Candidatus Micrarchaeota archaeon]|nr:orotate phosphoribosyltransferase [Candidatus Micrarchaeota archaeon]
MASLKPFQEQLVQFLVKQGVLQFGEFKLKSGRLSPYYYNARNLSNGFALSQISSVYAQKIVDEKLDPDVLFGPAYAGIPLASATALQLQEKHGMNVRFAYDRKEVKEYGDKNTAVIVGTIKEFDRVLIIDDIITTGATKLETKVKIDAVAKVNNAGILVAFDRKEKDENGVVASQALKEQGLPVHSVLDAPSVFDYLHNKDIDGKVYVTDHHFSDFKKYRSQYGV